MRCAAAALIGGRGLLSARARTFGGHSPFSPRPFADAPSPLPIVDCASDRTSIPAPGEIRLPVNVPPQSKRMRAMHAQPRAS